MPMFVHLEVDPAAADGHLDATILRKAPLGDVHAGDDLEARGHRALHVLWNVITTVAHAVDPVTHQNAVCHRLVVTVTCPRTPCSAS